MHMRLTIGLLMLALTSTIATKMIVQSPPELANFFKTKYGDEGIPYGIANYGVIPYGKVVSGEVGVPEFLQDCVYEDIPDTARKSIMLVQRNDCTFTQKSINVQKEGGKLAIVIDNKVERPESIVMSDDGKGHFVTIPTVIISREDGLKILDYIGQNLIIMVAFEVKVTSRSNVTLWLDILDHKNFIFLRQFQSFYQRIANDSNHTNNTVDFHVAYPTSRCTNDCLEKNCFYGGKYCRYPVKFSKVENGGKEVIRQQLRQYYIFQESPEKWWKYILSFDDSCDDLAVFNECSNKVLSGLNLKPTSISQKVDTSFQKDDNELLRIYSEQKYNSTIIYYPSVVINSMVYRGNLEPYQVFETICESMTPTPSGCNTDSSPDNSHLVSWIAFGIISVVVFIIFLIVCFRRIARRQLSQEMNKKVNQLVNEYISMYQVEKFKQGEIEMKNKS